MADETKADFHSDVEKGPVHELDGRRGSVGVVEIGAGDGTVTKDLIEELAKAGHAVASDGHGHATISLDEAALRKVRWRCDLCLMPIICMMYLWCFIDRANIGNARLYGLEKDLGMAGYDYNIVLTGFFVAYVVFEWPINILCKIVGPGRWLPFLTFMFGLCSLLTCLVQSRAGLIAVRFFLGIFESGLLPGIAYTLTRWYSKDEVVFRLSMYIATAPLAGAFGGLLAYGIVNDLTNIASLTTWRMLFFIEGLVTVSVGIGAFFLMADKPSTAKWLTHDQKVLIEARSKLESIGITQQLETVKRDTIWSGVKSANVLILGPVLLLNSMTVQGIAVFLPTIVTAQYPADSAVTRNLRTVPPYIVGLFWVLLMSFLAWKTARRGIYCLITAPFAMLGFALFMGGQTPEVQYAGAFFVAMGSFPFGSLIFGWLAANLSPDAARASGMGLGAFFQNIGGLISAWLYLPKDAPRYYPGHATNLAGAVIQWCLCFFLIFYQKNENKKREAGKRDYRLSTRTPEQIAVLGHRHPQFRYAH